MFVPRGDSWSESDCELDSEAAFNCGSVTLLEQPARRHAASRKILLIILPKLL